MDLGMVGLGRMGANMVRRLMKDGHRCVAYDRAADAVATLAAEGAVGAASPAALAAALPSPRFVWLMVPAAIVDRAIDDLLPHLAPDDTIIDGGNSRFHDDITRARRLGSAGIHYVDCGTSGGVFGLDRGYCLMIGGEADVVQRLRPIFETLAPGAHAAPPTAGRTRTDSTADHGFLHCGPAGAGHFVKMIHNAIEYGMMQAYAEGFNLLRHAGAGRHERAIDAETTPLDHPEYYRYDFDVGEIAELWRRGSVIPSWLLDLATQALADDPALAGYQGRVSDSGEGRWTLAAANDLGVPIHVLAGALFERFTSRGEADYANKMLSALRHQFGGHVERPHA
ncbi:MAG: decarboxylating 6-phosphogluconate dehydrogenase [Gemmatimonadaceae bacterium]|nr:decarboxylating 6-phosphogluconate dehydrogenase [Gemmatimonadaceae bacterium]